MKEAEANNSSASVQYFPNGSGKKESKSFISKRHFHYYNKLPKVDEIKQSITE